MFAPILSLLACAACSPAAVPTVNPPAGVARFAQERSFDNAVAAAETDLLQGLRRDYGRLETQRFEAPRNVTWDQLRAHYAAQLGPDWKPDAHFAEQGSGYRRVVWRLNGGPLRPARALALAYLDQIPAEFAVLIVARSATD